MGEGQPSPYYGFIMSILSDFFDSVGGFVTDAGNTLAEYSLQREEIQLEQLQAQDRLNYFQSFSQPLQNTTPVQGGNNSILMIGAVILGGALLVKAIK